MTQGRALKPGETGTIEVTVQRRDSEKRWRKVDRWKAGDRVRARAYHRDLDGRTREVSRVAATKVEAIQALEKALEAPSSVQSGHLTASTRVGEAVEVWLRQAEREDSGLAPSTVALYRSTARRYVIGSPVSALRLHELAPANLRSYLQTVADARGTSSAKLTRTVLSGVISLAMADGLLRSDPLRSVRPVKAQPRPQTPGRFRDHKRALTREERDLLILLLDARATEEHLTPRTVCKRAAVANLLAFLAGTGVRVDEARSLKWGDVSSDLSTVLIRGTKSARAHRSLTLPPWLRDRLARILSEDNESYVFPSPASEDGHNKWDQSNSARAIREALDDCGFEWAVSHTFRRTVATLAAGAGLPLVRIADQLGHANPTMTASVYLGRDYMGERPDLAAVL